MNIKTILLLVCISHNAWAMEQNVKNKKEEITCHIDDLEETLKKLAKQEPQPITAHITDNKKIISYTITIEKTDDGPEEYEAQFHKYGESKIRTYFSDQFATINTDGSIRETQILHHIKKEFTEDKNWSKDSVRTKVENLIRNRSQEKGISTHVKFHLINPNTTRIVASSLLKIYPQKAKFYPNRCKFSEPCSDGANKCGNYYTLPDYLDEIVSDIESICDIPEPHTYFEIIASDFNQLPAQ